MIMKMITIITEDGKKNCSYHHWLGKKYGRPKDNDSRNKIIRAANEKMCDV